MNLLNIINSSLKIDYCSMTLSNHDMIRLVRFFEILGTLSIISRKDKKN